MKRTILLVLHSIWFFTRIPVPLKKINNEVLIESRIFLPLVGAIVGMGAVLLFVTSINFLPKSVAILLVMTFLVLITGAFHEDGLADAADAFGATGDKKRILEIIKDSRIGTYGALALIIAFAAKFFLLYETPVSVLPALIFFGQVAGRFSALPIMITLPYVRHDSTFESAVTHYVHTINRVKVISVGILTSLVGWFLFGSISLVMMLAVLCVSALSGWYYKRKLGGATGDCYGATIELSQITVYFFGALV